MLDARVQNTEAAVSVSRWSSITRNDVVVAALLVFVLLTGGYFRFIGTNWDDFVRFHPDERFLTGQVATSIDRGILNFSGSEPAEAQRERCLARHPDTNGVGGYFDTQCSDWNPHNVGAGFYVYGTLPLFTAYITADAVAQITGDVEWRGYNGLHLVWRTISAVVDMVTILVVFFIGRQLHGRWVGLLAAALYAFAVFPIQQAHFGTADAMANLFVTLSVLFAVRVQERGSWWDYAGFGLALGMALASRINIAPVVGLVIVAALLRVLPAFAGNYPDDERTRIFNHNFAGLVLAGFITILAFRIFNPYAFSGPGFFGLIPDEQWLANIAEAQEQNTGAWDAPPNYQWINRTAFLYPLSNMVLWGMGVAFGVISWVAWAWSGWRVLRGKPGALRNVLLFGWILVYFGWLGDNWVTSMRYFLPLYPVLAVLAAWMLVDFVKRADKTWARIASRGLLAFVAGFTLLWGAMFTNIYRNQATFVQATYWIFENVPGDFAMQIEDAPDGTPLININLRHTQFNHQTHPYETFVVDGATRLLDAQPQTVTFTPYTSGTITHVHAPHLGDLGDDPDIETVTVNVSQEGNIIASASLSANLIRDEHPLGDTYDLFFDNAFEVEAGESYDFTVAVTGGPIATGTVMASELAWEEVVPVKVCELPPGMSLADDLPPGMFSADECRGIVPYTSQVQILDFDMPSEDAPGFDPEYKRSRIETVLNHSDYIIIPTNRRYDTHSRNRDRWPLTNAYYDALFSGELGFEVAAYFQETFELGPLRVSDQHLPIYDSPDWLNEFEAEEAFHVYDHPVVFIFRKTEAYSPENTRDILYSVNLSEVAGSYFGVYNDTTVSGVTNRPSLVADEAPTLLQFTPEMRDIQYDNGTWSDMFDRESWINANPIVTVLVWWLAIVLIGVITFPVLFLLLPGLADRGYGFAKILGMFVVGWAAWYLATMRIQSWSQAGLLIGFAIMALISALIVWRKRGEIIAYLRANWQLLLGIEAISLLLFVMFFFIRMTNPDLWVQGFGGEKPMNFAYFNAVLRSTIFPPIDPWYAGGYINYYYFGYVIVGVPTLLLGVVPSIAYNLLLPTLYSVTGLAAFSAAFNVVSGWHTSQPKDTSPDETTSAETTPDTPAKPAKRRRTLGNPWVAGITALLLAVVLGNLDTVRVYANGIAQLGGYELPQGLTHYYESELIDDYIEDFNAEPIDMALADIQNQARLLTQEAGFVDEVEYQVHKVTSLIGGLGRGFGEMLQGNTPNIVPNRWFWAPTRVIAEIPEVSDSSIAEMPFFTFLYGDLHAHMIAMPLIVFVVVFVFHEIIIAGNDKRRWTTQYAALALGGAVVGMSKAVNTWDYPTLLILSVLGLGFAWWLKWERINRRSIVDVLFRVGGFVIFTALAVLPYDLWFATAFTQLQRWQGGNTPVWAYLDIHGLFLFLIASMLVWETARWMRSTTVGALRGKATLIGSVLFFFAIVTVISWMFFFNGERVMVIALPMIAWIAVLFFRPNQSRAMQFILVLAGLALSITLGVEFFVLSGDNGRQNMVFKFYIQVWLFFSVAGGAAFAWVVSNSDWWRDSLRNVWYGFAGLLFFLALLYPIMATQGKAVYRMASDIPFTIDGMEFMQHARHWEGGVDDYFDLIHDYNTIQWLQENVEGSPVIMEAQAQGSLYKWGGRISIHTGLPSVVGWDHHQTQQRSLPPMPSLVRQRAANVNAFYTTPDIDAAARILNRYDVGYVIVSSYERARYASTGGLMKLGAMVDLGMLELVYLEDEAAVYRVIQDALPPVAIAAVTEDGQ